MNFRHLSLGLYLLRCVDCHKIRIRFTRLGAVGASYRHDDVCKVQIENRLRRWHTCACGCPAAPAGECTCGSLCECDPCPSYCDRDATAPWPHDATTPLYHL